MRHALRSWSRQRVGLASALVMLLAAVLAGCGYASPTQPAAVGTSPADQPTATPTLLTVTPYIEVPASTAGWQTYTDSTYHFKTVIPPGWRLGTVYDNTEPNVGGPCSYDAIFFPPGDTHKVDPLALLQMHEYMVIYVNLYCPPPSDTPSHLPESAGTVMVSGIPVKVYAEDTSDGVKRIASANFSDHVYTFYVLGTTSDGPLYMGVLRGFVHSGA